MYSFNDFNSRQNSPGIYHIVIVPKSGSFVFGHIDVYSGTIIVI